jgi:hypothetical protein
MEPHRLQCMSSNPEHSPDINLLMCRDEWNSDLDGGVNFGDFYPAWRNTVLWEQWKKYARNCFAKGLK